VILFREQIYHGVTEDTEGNEFHIATPTASSHRLDNRTFSLIFKGGLPLLHQSSADMIVDHVQAPSFMKHFKPLLLFTTASLSILLTVHLFINTGSAHWQNQSAAAVSGEDAYRANNVGVALLEQFKYKEAADAFRRALQLDPKLSLARINLGIALFNLPDLAAAQRELQAVIKIAPATPQPHYVLGLVARTQNRAEDAIASFQRVLETDPDDVGANVNLGQLYAQQRKYAEAITVLRRALAVEPYNSTALYNLGTALLRSGQRDEGQKIIKQFQELRERGSGTTLGTNYLEQGRYAEALSSTGAENELVDQNTPRVTFTDATAEFFGAAQAPGTPKSPIFGRQLNNTELNNTQRLELVSALDNLATFFDFDQDGDLDLFAAGSGARHLYRNDAGKFVDVINQAGELNTKVAGAALGAVAGDYDNDGRPDLFLIRSEGLSLYHNDGGKFSDVSTAAGLPGYSHLASSTAFVDFDHDGDLDIFVAGLASLTGPRKDLSAAVFPDDFNRGPSLLLRNNGDGKFTDVTASARLDRLAHSVAVVPSDVNNRRDVDLLLVNYNQPLELFSNLRDGTFRNVADVSGMGVSGRWTCVAAGDVNKDGYTDFFLGRADGPGLFLISDGQGKFKSNAAPNGSEKARAALFLDYDNDGLLDCVSLTEKGLRLWRNLGQGWSDVSQQATSNDLSKNSQGHSRLLAAADMDGDGDQDLIFPSASGELKVARNDGGNANISLRVNLAGRVSNRSGVGAKIEIRAGSLAQKLETYAASPAPAAADVIFGLGKRTTVDALRVLWPAGIVQAETELVEAAPPSGATSRKAPLQFSVTELDRKPSSCPYLYVWNGKTFEFVTDFMGGGEMGHLESPGVYNLPDPDEYVRIPVDLLKERNGRYELKVTNELEEAVFADRLQLVAVAHPQEANVYPNEGLTGPPFKSLELYSTRNAQPPLAAVDDQGRDMLTLISYVDREYPDDFRLQQIRGYADEHTLTLKLLPQQSTKQKFETAHARQQRRIILLLTGWTDYAWSSDNLAAFQGGRSLKLPALQVKGPGGQWQTVVKNVGIPVGRPQTVAVDLTDKFLTADREVRIVTNMRIYWDQILVDTSSDNVPMRLTRLDPVEADLRWRGFSEEFSPDGRQPLVYNYDRVSLTSPWKVMTGRYTREGDVRALLRKSDDMFVVSRPGDEISLSFSAKALPPLPRGWTRTFLLYADGFSKEMDINSASPDQVGPLPFHGMSQYPYRWPEQYPLTRTRQKYLEIYNTRVVSSPIHSIDTELLLGR
jgi:tetratricopeptide (TPR) repeat protein